MFLKNVTNIGKAIRDDKNWKNNKDYFSEIKNEAAERFFQSFHRESLEFMKEDELIDLFYGTVALEYFFDLRFGSATPTVAILNELGKRNPDHFEMHGNWAGANRGNNSYTPFGYSRGFRTYQEFLEHPIKVKAREEAALENARIAREQKKSLKALQHQERLAIKKIRDEEKRSLGLIPSHKRSAELDEKKTGAG